MKKIILIVTAILFVSCNSTQKKSSELQVSDLNTKQNVEQLYSKNCSQCHASNRSGLSGPALIPETLGKMNDNELVSVIRNGREATQMSGFKDKLTDDDIKGLAKYVKSAAATGGMTWSESDIMKSRQIFLKKRTLRPQFSGDRWNLFFIVSHGDHGLSIMDGDSYKVLKHLNMRPGIHGGIKYSPDGKFAYAMTRDGWLSVIDVYALKLKAEVRVAINSRNIAVSEDGKYVLVGNNLPSSLALLDATTLKLIKYVPTTSKVSAVYTAFGRKSFVVAYKDMPKVFELSSQLEVKKETQLREPLDDFMFDPSYRYVLGTSRSGVKAQVVDLNVSKVVAELPIDGVPHLGSGIAFKKDHKIYLAVPNMKVGKISIIDTSNWTVAKEVLTSGPGFFLRTHENTDYIFADSFLSSKKDQLHIISKKEMNLKQTVSPEPGQSIAHTEFSKDGRFVLISVWEDDGAILVYDTKTLQEVARVQMKKPSGKYNIYNKTHLSFGTSH